MAQKREEVSLAIDCSTHKDCLADMFCIEPQCFNLGLICTQCYLDSHADHQFCTTTELAYKLSQLINLPKQNGGENFEEKLANIQGTILAVTQQLSETIDIFKKKLQQIKSAFERYNTINADVNSIHNFIQILKGNGNPAQYRECLQELLQKISLKGRLFVLNQAEQLQNQQLYLPNDKIVTQCLEPVIEQIQNFNKKCQQQLQQGEYYEKLDLNFPFGLTLLSVDKKEIIENPEQLRAKAEIVAQRYQIFKETHVLSKNKLIPIIDPTQQEIREGTERIEKVFLIGGSRIWFKDLIYTKFRAKNWTIEPRSACMICKCHPRFARIREFLDVKYGELYGPINHDKMIYYQYKQAFTQSRPELTYIIDKTNIYLHDLCAYWSTNVKSDEERGTIDFNSFALAIAISQKKDCYLCKRVGATLKCNYSTCDTWIHYYCFRNLNPEQQYLDDIDKFRMRCHKHKTDPDIQPQWFLNQEAEQGKQQGQYIHKEEFNVIDFANNLQVEKKNNVKMKKEGQNKFEV